MILLTDDEIKQAIVEADKEIWACKAHPRWEGEKYLMKAQLKKVVEWGKEDCPHNCPSKADCTECWQAILKEAQE